MHEMSIAMDVCRIAEEKIGSDHLTELTAVAVEIGADAGIEPDSLEFCLGVLLTQPPFHNARAILLRVPGDVLRVSYLEVDDGSPDN